MNTQTTGTVHRTSEKLLKLRPAAAGVLAVLLLAAGWVSGAVTDDSEFFARSGSRYAAIIQASEAAFMDRDLENAIKDLDDDYIMYDVNDAGAEERIRGMEQVRAALGPMLESDIWVGSEVDRLALLDNTLVQVEHDTFKTDDGTKTVSTLVVFEHRNGKRWREWRFVPADR